MSSKDWQISKNMLSIDDSVEWDFKIKQQKDESYLSWFSRIAKGNSADPNILFELLLPNMKKKKIEQLDFDIAVKKELIVNLGKFISELANLLEDGDSRVKFEYFEETEILGFEASIKYCNICLKEDEVPFFRINWQYKSILTCLHHKVVLFDQCPFCLKCIKYWKTGYKRSLLDCWNCNGNITESIVNSSSIATIIVFFQQKIMEIYNTGRFVFFDINIDTIEFSSRFSRLMMIEFDTLINNFHISYNNLTIHEKLIALGRTYEALLSHPKRLDNPFQCVLCDSDYRTEEDLYHDDCQFGENFSKLRDLQEKLHQGNYSRMDVAKFRHLVVRTLIDQETTAVSVQRMGNKVGFAASTIWTWIKKYREYNTITCLKTNYSNSGRKSKYTEAVKDYYYQTYLNKPVEKSFKEFYQIATRKLKSGNGENEELPSYSTVRRIIIDRENENHLE